jgi:uncharacterized membrane protein
MNWETTKRTPMVTLKTVDRLVGLLIIGIILFGSYSWWQTTQRALERDGMMMGEMMGTMPGMDPVWYLFGTLIAVSVVLGVYVISREQLADVLSASTADATTNDHNESKIPMDSSSRSSESASEQSTQESSTNNPPSERISALKFLPEDERRIIEPILESPGLTQVEIRGRSDFSKAKVSQTVTELEDRGLIYREKQGRTYRVYPGELLKDRQQS